MSMNDNILDFLHRRGMSPADVDLPRLTKGFCEQMELGLLGEASSLMMVPSYLPGSFVPRPGMNAAVLDAGGSNLRAALVDFTDRGPEISDFVSLPMPGLDEPITTDDLFDDLAQLLRPMLGRTQNLGFCFSFPAEILPNRDARILRFNKQVQIQGGHGLILCQELDKRLKDLGVPGQRRYAVCNDTVSTLLSGLTCHGGTDYDAAIGLIIGTGTNTCYIENQANISAIPSDTGRMIVNIESAGFNGFTPGSIERRVDSLTLDPGEHPLEKCVSGAYLGQVIYHTALEAGAEGLLSAEALSGLETLGGLTTAQADQFCRNPMDGGVLTKHCVSGRDREIMVCFIENAMERAARLLCANLGGILLKSGNGGKALICAEGSVFERSLLLRPKLEALAESYIYGQLGWQCSFVTTKDANILGAAAAVCSLGAGARQGIRPGAYEDLA